MAEKPASLLTKTQRRRLAAEFQGVEGAKRRRDQRQIRERVATGLADFEHLVDYPDEQLELALDDLDDDELERVLAEVVLVAERVRVLRDLERTPVVETARELAADGEAATLDRLDLRTPDEHRAAVEQAVTDEREPSPWLGRAELLLKLGLLFLALTLVIAAAVPGSVFGPTGGIAALVGAFTVLFGLLALVAGLAIVALRGVKHDLVPAVAVLLADPAGAIRRTWDRL